MRQSINSDLKNDEHENIDEHCAEESIANDWFKRKDSRNESVPPQEWKKHKYGRPWLLSKNAFFAMKLLTCCRTLCCSMTVVAEPCDGHGR
jgi:hypothetical protein